MRTLLVFAALLPLGAIAADPESSASDELNETLADDLVVTATRTTASASDTPVSISRISGDDFALAAAKHQADLLNQSPGVYVQRGSGAESLVAIRSPVLAGAGACGAFLVAEDSLPIRPVGFCNLNEMFEVNFAQAKTIEVLRGPGSAMFGASAVHGIVNVLTPRVSAMPELFLSAETGADSFKRIGLGWAPRESSKVALYGMATRAPGWRDASGVDEVKLNLLTDLFPLGPGELRIRASGTVLNQETAGFIQGFNSYRSESQARSNPNPEAFRDASSARVSAVYSTDTPYDNEDFFEVSALYRRSRMDFSQHFLIGKPVEHNAQTSYLVSGAWGFERGNWSTRLALDAETANTELTEFQSGPATDGAPAANAIRPAGYHYDYTVDSRNFGGTASVEYQFAEHWRATAALRADTTRYEYDNRMLTGNTDARGVRCGASGCLYARPADRSDNFDNLAPRITIGWAGGARHYYLSASRGFRPPEMTELYRLQRQQTVAELDSERLDSFELGAKSQGEISWEVALFAMRKRDVILRESNGFNVGNGATRHQGVEYRIACEGCGPAQHEFLVALSGTMAKHTYDFSRAVEGGETIVAGNDVDTAPRQLHSLELAYPARASDGPWQASATLNYVGTYYLDAANTAKYGGHRTTDLRLRWQAARHTALTLRVDNLFDTAYADRADFAFGNYRYFPAQGRAAFLSVDYSRN